MKLICCPKCGGLRSLPTPKKVVTCECKLCAGKYLSDRNTAVFTRNTIIVGIDNNSFNTAVQRYREFKTKYATRLDFFFVGWVPTIPGEIILVDTIEEVRKYPYKVKVVATTSTMPTSKEVSDESSTKPVMEAVSNG